MDGYWCRSECSEYKDEIKKKLFRLFATIVCFGSQRNAWTKGKNGLKNISADARLLYRFMFLCELRRLLPAKIVLRMTKTIQHINSFSRLFSIWWAPAEVIGSHLHVQNLFRWQFFFSNKFYCDLYVVSKWSRGENIHKIRSLTHWPLRRKMVKCVALYVCHLLHIGLNSKRYAIITFFGFQLHLRWLLKLRPISIFYMLRKTRTTHSHRHKHTTHTTTQSLRFCWVLKYGLWNENCLFAR